MFVKRKHETTTNYTNGRSSGSSSRLQKNQRTRGTFEGVSFLKYALYAVSSYIFFVHMLFMNYGDIQSYWSNLDFFLETNDGSYNDDACSTSQDTAIMSRSFDWCDDSYCLPKNDVVVSKSLLLLSSANNEREPKKKSSIHSLVVHNPLDHERRVCGKTIPPKYTMYFSVGRSHTSRGNNMYLPCFLQDGESMSLSTSLSTLFPLPPIEGNRHNISPPIQLEFPSSDPKPFSEIPFTPCDVPCQERGKGAVAGFNPRKVIGTNWQITKSLEGQGYYEHLRVNETAYLSNKYYSTTSHQSEIPTSYFNMKNGMKDENPPVEYETAIRGASFLARNCASKNHREALVHNLTNHMIQKGWIPAKGSQNGNSTNSTNSSTFSPADDTNFIRIDRLGKCLNNADPPPGVNIRNKHETMRAYLFHLAFENQNEKDYITEKLWNVLKAGTIPVYLGHETIYEHLPDHMISSIINVHDFNSHEDLGDYLVKVANNKTLYESYHAWRRQPYPLKFIQKHNYTNTHNICRTCRWAVAKKYGLAFDHPSQTLQELFIPRKLCWNKKKKEEQQLEEGESRDYHEQNVVVNSDWELEIDASLFLTHPFRESWVISPQTKTTTNNESRQKCVESQLMPMEETCEKNSTVILKTSLSFKGTSPYLHRIVQYHDGVIDMIISMEEDTLAQNQQTSQKDAQNLVLQLDMMSSFSMALMKAKDSNNNIDSSNNNNITFNQFGKRESFIQNEVSRMTLLTDWDVAIDNPNDGILHIPIVFDENTLAFQNNTHKKNLTTISNTVQNGRTLYKRYKPTKRIRFIVENVDTFHKGANSQLYYYFGELMKKDFFHPIEKFIVVEEKI